MSSGYLVMRVRGCREHSQGWSKVSWANKTGSRCLNNISITALWAGGLSCLSCPSKCRHSESKLAQWITSDDVYPLSLARTKNANSQLRRLAIRWYWWSELLGPLLGWYPSNMSIAATFYELRWGEDNFVDLSHWSSARWHVQQRAGSAQWALEPSRDGAECWMCCKTICWMRFKTIARPECSLLDNLAARGSRGWLRQYLGKTSRKLQTQPTGFCRIY